MNLRIQKERLSNSLMRCNVFIFVFYLCNQIYGQGVLPPVCTPPPAMEPTCAEACIICDIDGFTGRNDSQTQGQAPPGFCTSEVHHMSWIGFVAGSTNLKVQVKVTNCIYNNGLEIGFYKGVGCTNFEKVTFCDTDIRENETAVFTNTVPLEIGQYYYIVMDGSGGDICDWSFDVLEGTTRLGELKTPAEIIMPDTICLGNQFLISTPGVVGGTDYLWVADDNIINTGKSFTHTFNKSGVVKVCVTPRNVCQIGEQSCKYVTVLPRDTSYVGVEICSNECYTWNGVEYCNSGKYPVLFKNRNGCDSTSILDLKVTQVVDESRDVTICRGDTFYIDKYVLVQQGTYPLKITNADGCELTLTINLILKDCEIRLNGQSDSLLCNDDKTGKLTFKVVNGVPPFSYEVVKLENLSIKLNGSIDAVNKEVVIDNLGAGTYYIVSMDNFGRETYLTEIISEPKKLLLSVSSPLKNGVNIACSGGDDGQILLKASGGTFPYVISGQGLEYLNNQMINGLKAGLYLYQVKDANNCQYIDSIELIAPDTLIGEYIIVDPTCANPYNGMIKFDYAKGGVPPYMMNVSGIQIGTSFQSIESGVHFFEFTDKNGCTYTVSDTIKNAQVPFLTTDTTYVEVILGDTLLFRVFDTIESEDYQWFSLYPGSCQNCREISYLPLWDANYNVIATSIDGCRDSLRIYAKVIKNRSFVLSNIVNISSINGNSHLKYYAGRDIERVDYIEVYDRWGSKVLEYTSLPNGVHILDNSSTFMGQELSQGIYAYLAKVLYIDGVAVTHKGSLTIIK